MSVPEPFAYASLLHARYVVSGREPTRDEISLLLYAFQAWGAVRGREPLSPEARASLLRGLEDARAGRVGALPDRFLDDD